MRGLDGHPLYPAQIRPVPDELESGDALAKNGCDLVYYKREDSTLEMGFFVRGGNDLVPVEVKAKSGRSQSLRTLIRGEHYGDIQWGVKLHGGNVGWSDGVLSLPYYVTFLLERYLSECDPLGRSPAIPANRPPRNAARPLARRIDAGPERALPEGVMAEFVRELADK